MWAAVNLRILGHLQILAKGDQTEFRVASSAPEAMVVVELSGARLQLFKWVHLTGTFLARVHKTRF